MWWSEVRKQTPLSHLTLWMLQRHVCRDGLWLYLLRSCYPTNAPVSTRLTWVGRTRDETELCPGRGASRMPSSHCFSISWVLQAEQNITPPSYCPPLPPFLLQHTHTHPYTCMHTRTSMYMRTHSNPCTKHTCAHTCTLMCTHSFLIHLWVMVWTKILPLSEKKKHGFSRTGCLSGLCSFSSYINAPAHTAPGMWPPWRFQNGQNTLLPPTSGHTGASGHHGLHPSLCLPPSLQNSILLILQVSAQMSVLKETFPGPST